MPVRIRLSRGGAKKRPFYRIVVADSRRARDGKFIDQVGTYNPMLNKENPERVKIDLEKEWILILGSEAHGMSDSLQSYITHSISVPGFGYMESLNVAVAGGILLHGLTDESVTN